VSSGASLDTLAEADEIDPDEIGDFTGQVEGDEGEEASLKALPVETVEGSRVELLELFEVGEPLELWSLNRDSFEMLRSRLKGAKAISVTASRKVR